MKLKRKQAVIVKNALSQWQYEGVITEAEAIKLGLSYEIMTFDWKRLAKYSFWLAIISIIISISFMFADEVITNFLLSAFDSLLSLFALPIAKSIFFALLAGCFLYFGIRSKRKRPHQIFTNEAILFLGVILIAVSIAFLGEAISIDIALIVETISTDFAFIAEAINADNVHFYILLILLASIVYCILGLLLNSNLLWIFGLLFLGIWLTAETGYLSGWGIYYLGMNYPFRFVLFGLILIGLALFLYHQPRLSEFYSPTAIVGLLCLFIALWIMSIIGNGDIEEWQVLKEYKWAIIFAVASIIAIYIGLYWDENLFLNFGVTFLFINLYTRFFEYFWVPFHKVLFFALLAATFLYIGSHALFNRLTKSPKMLLEQ